MAAMRLTLSGARAMCDALVDSIDSGVGAGSIQIRSGTQPAQADDAPTGTLLVSMNLPEPAFGAAVDNDPGAIATANAISNVAASGTGTATWFRVTDGDGNTVMDGDCGEGGSGADMILDNADINSGQDVQVNSWTVEMPEK